MNFSKLIFMENWISMYEQNIPEHAYNNFLKFVFDIVNFVFHYQKTPYLINHGKIGAFQELSSLVKLNVNFIKYLSIILHQQNYVIFRSKPNEIIRIAKQ